MNKSDTAWPVRSWLKMITTVRRGRGTEEMFDWHLCGQPAWNISISSARIDQPFISELHGTGTRSLQPRDTNTNRPEKMKTTACAQPSRQHQ